MTARIIDQEPNTEASLRKDLTTIGVVAGMNLIVHSSLSSIGWVLGGPSTVVRALFQVIGNEGTLVMPAATPHCVDPAQWTDISIPDRWLETAREHLPVFDPETTQTQMGAIPEVFRTWPGTIRSTHPLESVCACGPLAKKVTEEHPLAFSEGPGSPFAKLYESNCWVLLIGVGFNRCTALHYAESLVAKRRTMNNRFPMLDQGRRVWIEVQNVADDNDTHFPVIGKQYMSLGKAKLGSIGEAKSVLFPIRDLVDFAVQYFKSVL